MGLYLFLAEYVSVTLQMKTKPRGDLPDRQIHRTESSILFHGTGPGLISNSQYTARGQYILFGAKGLEMFYFLLSSIYFFIPLFVSSPFVFSISESFFKPLFIFLF